MKRNTIMNKLHHCISATLLFTLISCTNLVQKNEDTLSNNSKSTDGKTYLVINTATIKSANGNRATIETKYDADPKDLTDLVLKGYNDPNNTEASLNVEAESFTELSEQKILIEPGDWNFTLTAKLHGIQFSGTTSAKIIEGDNNKISFELTSEVDYGKLDLTVKWTNEATKVTVNLYNADTDKLITNKSTKTFTEIEETNESSASFTFDKLSGGKYKLSVLLDHDLDLNFSKVDNCIVIIKEGITIHETISLDLSPSYTINYENNGGDFDEGQTIRYSYTRKTSLSMPKISKPGYIFDGWYKTPDFTGSKIVTFFGFENTENVTFYAKWRAPELYVSGTGNDTTGNGTEAKPFKTIDKACEEIIATGDENMNWAIKIIGEVKGVPKGSSGTDATYGPNTISADVTQDYAKSILLTGVTPIETEFAEPQDSLNRNQSSNVNGVSYGTVLTIETSVPVTITNLKITGGVGSSEKGAGIHISSGATVMLGDGVLLIHNRAGSNSHGGAIQNEGTLFIYGTAVIGDKSKEEYVYDSSTDYSFSTTSNRGGGAGGVYNGNPTDNTISAKLYLGYKGYDSDGVTLVKEEFKGGFYHNGGSAGALYNCANCFVYFDSGTMAWNGTCASGGAIRNDAYGTIEMTGGSILNNRSYEGGNYTSYGGGVYNAANAVFVMSGGTINKNVSANNTGYGGGVYNCGKFYMYGTAVIGKKDAKTCATAEDFGNKASQGGGFYNNETGCLYIGYKPDDNGDPVETTLSGGIYYNYSFYPTITDTNYSQNGGGAIESTGTIKIASGTIAYNTTEGYGGAVRYVAGKNENVFEITGGTITNNIAKGTGGAIYLGVKNAGNANVLYFGGSPVIPVENSVEGFENYLNDIYIRGLGTTIQLISSLPQTFTTSLSFYEYNTTINPLKIKTDSSVTLADEYTKFKVIDENLNGRTRMWKTTAEGKLEPVVSAFYVSENGDASNDGLTKDTAFAAVSSAFTKIWMNYNQDHSNANQDYIIYISGNVNDRVNIEDMTAVKYANSITLQGLNGLDTSTNLPKDTINGNYADGESGNTVSISSIIPVAIKALNITGSKMDASTYLGAGLNINPGSTVSLEDGTVISGNERGVNAVQASLFIDDATIKNNTSKDDGAGLSLHSSNVKMISGSISNNSFNTDFLTANNITEVSGGGVYLDNSTFEMTGGTISDNGSANSGVSVIGKGIYVSSDSTFNMGGTAFVSLENDVYLDNNVKVNVISKLKENASLNFARNNPAAMLTPAIYPTQNEEGNITANVELLNLVDSELKMYDIAKLFRITPQKINNDLQYWKIDSNSSNTETYGKFIKTSGTTVTVNYSSGYQDDVAVSVLNPEGSIIEDGAVIPGGGTLTFKATEGYSSYKWTLDGELQTAPTTAPHILSIDTTNWDYGTYVIYLEVKDTSGKRYSYTTQIKVSEN